MNKHIVFWLVLVNPHAHPHLIELQTLSAYFPTGSCGLRYDKFHRLAILLTHSDSRVGVCRYSHGRRSSCRDAYQRRSLTASDTDSDFSTRWLLV